MITQKPKCGFHLNFGMPLLHPFLSQPCLNLMSFSVWPQSVFFACFSGNANITRIFDGEPDQLVPSSSACLVDSDLFLMAGKMIGHCFLHGGPPLSGLSPAVVHVISGGNAETAVVHISDCPYFDLRKKIMLVCILPLDICCVTVIHAADVNNWKHWLIS